MDIHYRIGKRLAPAGGMFNSAEGLTNDVLLYAIGLPFYIIIMKEGEQTYYVLIV